MARRPKDNADPLQGLTELELEIMKVIWRRGDATAAEVTGDLRESRALAETTVHTVLSNLRKKGVIEPIPTIERAMRYKTTVEKRQVADRRLKDVLADFFGGSPQRMVLHLLKEESLDEKEMEEIRRLFREQSDNDSTHQSTNKGKRS